MQSSNRRRSLSRDCTTANPHVSQPRRANFDSHRSCYFVPNEAGNNRARSAASCSACRGSNSINVSKLSGGVVAKSRNILSRFCNLRLHLKVKNALHSHQIYYTLPRSQRETKACTSCRFRSDASGSERCILVRFYCREQMHR